MPGSFVHRRISVSFAQGQGVTGQAGVSTSQLLGKRISAKISKFGNIGHGTASIQIYGMTLSAMNALSRAGWNLSKLKRASVLVMAGDDDNGMSEVFAGQVTYAWPDMTNQPQVVFRVEAQSGPFDGIKPAESTSFKGQVPFQTVAQAIAKKFEVPRQLQLNGINKMLENPYFFGSPLQQFHALAKQARVAWVDDDEKTLAAWPVGGVRSGGNNGVISKETGMVADPIGTPNGIIVKQLFTKPYEYGTQITVKSIIDQANGTWGITRLDYSLESEIPHGEWFVTIDAQPIGGGGGGG